MTNVIPYSWSSWRSNCTESLTSISSYPRPLSAGTAVPAWAYLDVVTADRFIAEAAQDNLGLPESLAGGATPTSNGTTPSQTQSQTATNTPSSSKSDNLPAIVGGAVGGAVGLGLIIVLIIYLMKRKSGKSKVPPSAEFSKVLPPGTPLPMGFDTHAVGFRTRTASPTSNGLLNEANPAYNQNNMNALYPDRPISYMNGTNSPPPPQPPVPPFAAPWSPPPVGHTPAPNAAGYSYTPPPPEMHADVYTPPPGSLGSG